MSTYTNERGNTVETGSNFGGCRYDYDFGGLGKGWAQYDTSQDASYFGVWVNKAERKVFTYCEGDTSMVTCPTRESFAAELANMEAFYGPAPPAATSYHVEDGVCVKTEYYDERPTA